jgi:UDP:flavonoid glycosyltransferase YjiC (YdhE family)
MRVLATFVGGWGHAEPLLALAELATGLGHEVVFAGQAAVVPRLGALGYRTLVVGPDTLVTARQDLVPVDREWERVVLRDHFVARFGRTRAEALGEVVARERPQLVVCDEADVGAVVAAERVGIPSVSVVVLAAGRMTAPDVIGDPWRDLRAATGLPDDPGLERFGGDLRLAPAPRSFWAPEVPWPRRQRAVRHPILDAVAGREPSRQAIVYVTLGTVFNLESGDLPERLLAAADRIDTDVVITTGPGLGPGELGVAASHVRVESYVPHREVLAGSAAVVCHGGSGTLTAALALGVPVVVLPMGADQLDNADRCAELGVGVVLDALTADAATIAGAIDEVRYDPAYRRAARTLAEEADAQPSLPAVAELASLLGVTRRPRAAGRR